MNLNFLRLVVPLMVLFIIGYLVVTTLPTIIGLASNLLFLVLFAIIFLGILSTCMVFIYRFFKINK